VWTATWHSISNLNGTPARNFPPFFQNPRLEKRQASLQLFSFLFCLLDVHHHNFLLHNLHNNIRRIIHSSPHIITTMDEPVDDGDDHDTLQDAIEVYAERQRRNADVAFTFERYVEY
jgi:hypothetical protein